MGNRYSTLIMDEFNKQNPDYLLIRKYKSKLTEKEFYDIIIQCFKDDIKGVISYLIKKDEINALIIDPSNIKHSGMPPISIAITLNSINIIDSLFQYGNFNCDRFDSSGATPLFYACERNNFDVVKLLIEKGANVNSIYKRHTPLYCCCESNKISINIIRLLLENGATCRDYDLYIACVYRNSETVRLLISYGFNNPLSLRYISNKDDIKFENLEVLINHMNSLSTNSPSVKAPLNNIKINCGICRTKCIFHKLFIGEVLIDCVICLEKKNKNYSGMCGHTICEDCVKLVK